MLPFCENAAVDLKGDDAEDAEDDGILYAALKVIIPRVPSTLPFG